MNTTIVHVEPWGYLKSEYIQVRITVTNQISASVVSLVLEVLDSYHMVYRTILIDLV